MPAGRRPEIGAAHGVSAAAARSQRRHAHAQALTRAMSEIGHCADCRTFTEQDVCTICANPRRQQNGQICVVESPADIHAIEQTGQFAGRYFVLMGHLSPLDGIGPGDIGLDRTEQRLEKESITEVILATNPTVEGKQPPTTSPRCAASMACSPAVSPMACRWAASWKWSTAPRCRIRWPGVTPSSSDVFPDGAIRPRLLPKISRRPLEKQDPDPHLILIVRFW